MMIALPNPDKSFTCTVFGPRDGPAGLDSLKTEADVRRAFQRDFPDVVPLMPNLAAEFMENPTSACPLPLRDGRPR